MPCATGNAAGRRALLGVPSAEGPSSQRSTTLSQVPVVNEFLPYYVAFHRYDIPSFRQGRQKVKSGSVPSTCCFHATRRVAPVRPSSIPGPSQSRFPRTSRPGRYRRTTADSNSTQAAATQRSVQSIPMPCPPQDNPSIPIASLRRFPPLDSTGRGHANEINRKSRWWKTEFHFNFSDADR